MIRYSSSDIKKIITFKTCIGKYLNLKIHQKVFLLKTWTLIPTHNFTHF